jgi:ABC-type dipeptide/oligopeptide/nickel transport system permease component
MLKNLIQNFSLDQVSMPAWMLILVLILAFVVLLYALATGKEVSIGKSLFKFKK